MADPPPDINPATADTGKDLGGAETTGAPRWVKVIGIIAAVVVILVALMVAFGGGSHGPGRHTGLGSPLPHSGITALVGHQL